MSALSCMTLTDTELLSLSSRQTYNDAIIPSINTPVNPINIYTNYSIKDIPISTETIHVNIPEHEDFEIIKVGKYKQATKENFEKWYQNHNRYQLEKDRQERS